MPVRHETRESQRGHWGELGGVHHHVLGDGERLNGAERRVATQGQDGHYAQYVHVKRECGREERLSSGWSSFSLRGRWCEGAKKGPVCLCSVCG